ATLREFKATNGLMLDLLLEHAECAQLALTPASPVVGTATAAAPPPVPAAPQTQWQQLLDFVTARPELRAFIDAGALLAEANNRCIAQYLVHRLADCFHGVVFFDVASNAWHVLERQGKCLPLAQAGQAERDCFVLFDDSRCRGADMKLRPNAVAALTMGPGMTKDKLMQAAGRMRQLGHSQRLLLLALPDVGRQVLEHRAACGGTLDSPPTSSQQWVVVPPQLPDDEAAIPT
ncbi:unnamed protein product, partial [marine sediment metagenome]